MADSHYSEQELAGVSRDEMMSALFAQMVMQQSQMAMMLLGKVPHPQSGETVKDLEAARMFIDQLEMIEVKTKGNLSKQEEQLLKQSLMSLRMGFVEAAQAPEAKGQPEVPKPASASEPGEHKFEPGPTHTDEELKKKFSKKY